MKIFILLSALFVVLFCVAQTNPNHVYVNGYYREGTYIAPHYRTTPNSTVNDNFSTVGNTNPYTGEDGTLPREYYNSSPPVYNDLPSLSTLNTVRAVEPDYITSGEYLRPTERSIETAALLEKIRNQAINFGKEDKGIEYHPIEINYGNNSVEEIQPSFGSFEPQHEFPVKIEKPVVKAKPYKQSSENNYNGLYLFIGLSFLGLFFIIRAVKT